MAKRVSVIIPVYNSERTIIQVLDSVRLQTAIHEVLEILIINDGSTDRSVDLIKGYIDKYPQMPIRFFSQSNSGVSVARNVGLKNAKGEFIAFLDSDDIWLPHKTERQLEVFDTNEDVVFLGAAYNDKPFIRRGRRITTLFKADIKDIYWSYFPVTPSIMFKRFALQKVGLFNESQRYGEDMGYYQKFWIHYNYFYLPEKLVQIGIGKNYFGESGLTSNLSGMHEGEIQNLKELYNQGCISEFFYFLVRSYLELKYFRRIYLKKLRNIINK